MAYTYENLRLPGDLNQLTVSSGETASGLLLTNSNGVVGTEIVRGVDSGCTISGGLMKVSSGGSALNTTVQLNSAIIYAGGFASGMTVSGISHSLPGRI